jgi:hypothetical protein
MKMAKNKYFDEIIKSHLNEKVSAINPSKDILGEAWNKKNCTNVSKMPYIINPIKKVSIATCCCLFLSFATVLSISPNARTFAAEKLNEIRSIFLIEKVGDEYKVVEKTEEVKIPYWNIGDIVGQYNEAKFKRLLGINFYLPDTVGKSFNRGDINSGITIFDIALKDQEAYYDEFFKAILDENAYKGLENFKMRRSISARYSDNEGNLLIFYISKLRDESKMKVIKEFNIEGIQCKLVQLPLARYTHTIKGNTTNDDVTKEPIEVELAQYLVWTYNDIPYSIISMHSELDVDTALNFAKSYIKDLKLQTKQNTSPSKLQ